jgi:4-alpha-glucanotransferase
MGEEARNFIGFLKNFGFHVWQILPVEHTGDCFSPYKCISAFAGEPMLIDPRMLLDMGLITQEELDERMAGMNEGCVDYGLVHVKQWDLLRKAFGRLECKPHKDFKPFWLDDYIMYMVVKKSEDAEFHQFVQWLFAEQWKALKEYANMAGVSIVGDMPIYVSEDSVETWRAPELFDMKAVGGAPPDYFNELGQRWGNPVYNWKLMEKDGFKWWIDRMRASIERYDIVRLDHFRGFESYWRIPANAEDARSGKWTKGPGMKLFKALKAELGELPVIAEDLGNITEDVIKLLKETGFPGMGVLQFGFLGDDEHLVHNYTENTIAYTGTHDNTTLLAWMYGLSHEDRERALFYLGYNGDWGTGGMACTINKAWIRLLYQSRASLVIVPIQDLLGYGEDTRTNTPGTVEGNWRWRIRGEMLNEIDKVFYKEIGKLFDRDNKLVKDKEEKK